MAIPSIFGDTTGLPVTTRSGIPYEVDVPSYRETWVPGANKTVIMARVPTEQAWDWITDMVGQAYIGSGMLRRDPPEQNPFDPNQYCTKIEQVDHGDISDSGTLEIDVDGGTHRTFADIDSGWPVTKWSRYRCTFEGMPFWVKTDDEVDAEAPGNERELERYVLRNRKSYMREQELPGGGFKTIEATPVTLFTTGFKFVAYADVTYTWVRVPVTQFMQMSEKDDWIGAINSTTFDTNGSANGGYSWLEGELMYVGYDDSNKYFDANEDWVVDVVYSFRWKKIGWNFFFKADGSTVEVSTDGTSGGTRPYADEQDFAELFRVS